MNGASPTTSAAQERKVLNVIWLAFLAAVGFYTLVLFILAQASQPFEPQFLSTLRLFFWAAAAALAWISFALRRQATSAAPPANAINPEGGQPQAAPQLRTACIITWAACEGVAVLGLVLGILSHRPADYLPFVLVAAALLYAHRPAAWPLERNRDAPVA